MINMVCFLIAHSDSTCKKIAVCIYNEGDELYDNLTICKRLKELQIMKKKVSTEAYQALRPEIWFWVFAFWNHPPPLGVRDVLRYKLIDIDEFAITLKNAITLVVRH